MNNTYLITLTPTGKFFFGGDMTFSVDGKDSEFTSYIIKSNKFPQQTSLLGMLRFLILRNDSDVFDTVSQRIKDGKRDKASGLIGPESFKKTGKDAGYGKIKKIYPCFLQKDEKNVVLLAKDAKNTVSFGNVVGVVNGISVSVPDKIDGFDSKDGITTLYKIDDVEVTEDDIFVEDVCNGINRDIKTGKVENDALFKQVSYRFNDRFYSYDSKTYNKNRKKLKNDNQEDIFSKCQYRFAFYAEVVDCDLETYNGQVVSVGGDNSQFIIGIKEESTSLNSDALNGSKVILTSPAYIPDLSAVKYAIADTVPFRCMSTKTATVESYNKKNQVYDYGEKLMLYTPGSVFFVKDSMMQDFVNVINDQKDFRQIGYNHYQVK